MARWLGRVAESLVGLRCGERSYVADEVPPEALTDEAMLVSASEPVRSEHLLPERLPTAWSTEGTTTAAALAAALGKARQTAVPWVLVQRAIMLGPDGGAIRLVNPAAARAHVLRGRRQPSNWGCRWCLRWPGRDLVGSAG